MERFDLNQLLVYENLVYQRSFGFKDEFIHLTTSQPPEPTDFFLPLTGDDALHVDNLLYWGVDSPVLPPDLLASNMSAAEATPVLAPLIHGLATMPNTSSMTSFPSTSAPVGPATACADLRASTRSSSFAYSPPEPQQDTSGPSAPPPSGWAGNFYPGESSFRLDLAVPPLKPNESVNQGKHRPHVDPNYPLCRCPSGPTTRPSRHWDVCPFNPERGRRPFPCEICGSAFTTKWNKDRHAKSCFRRES